MTRNLNVVKTICYFMTIWKTRPPRFSDAFKMYPNRYEIIAGMGILTTGIIATHCTRMTEKAKKIAAPTLLLTGTAIALKGIYDMIKRG